jgi:hypothetical protein
MTNIKNFTLICGKILFSVFMYNIIMESGSLMILEMQNEAYGKIDRLAFLAIIIILPLSALYTKNYFINNNKVWLSTVVASIIVYGLSKIIYGIEYHGTLLTVSCLFIIILPIIKFFSKLKEEDFLDED